MSGRVRLFLDNDSTNLSFLQLTGTQMKKRITRFAAVGMAGFAVDSLIFFMLMYVSDNLLLNRFVAFWIAACTTWLGNRHFTFKAQNQNPVWQWGKHMLSCHLSGLCNIAVFYVLVPVTGIYLAFVVGILVGTVTNYLLSSLLVFTTDNSRNQSEVQLR